MKLSNLVLLSSAALTLAAPAVHHNDHQNAKRAVVTVTEFVDENGNAIAPETAAPETATAQQAAPVAQPTTTAGTPTTLIGTTQQAAAATTQAATTQAATHQASSNNAGGIDGDLADFASPSGSFQDGTVKCSDFPSGNGVISIDWAGMGGWTSIMDMDGHTSTECTDGFYCSYACQAGMSKTQWPENQPSDGRSVGGLLCKNGYLYRANQNSENLCEWGHATAKAVNNVGQQIALCRTDYPGSENMNLPTVVSAGSSKPMCIVDEDSYYKWQGKKTSAQYYVNNAGVSAQDGCIWGQDGSGVGNWAPVVLGSGYTDGRTYLSIIPNPNNRSPPNYNVKIVADEGSSISGDCSYENGSYTGSGSDGCTVTVTSGSANFVFY
ncbi:SUN family protein UTH1 KNAG_0C01380 [Huiozyma naganishii CBS 8797]|uniref:Uncharacterized protein n=1 Tax=Huiozyma naganishii (strain ATCC MYA-139 / BCRC 22969 / CBS 8797 / KCTC 17520 / NBRC 10181 / NCYC 3082 / Yp74L-3) TaxID=1071383 RepID=J7S5M8_HUIN7|nr:hypothetical protein KNAG_0C01380 [Kazachstania naganishii CBS 8797]CCK69251.1 hypothetical protein KNAG_0C01380 [Kazachstania naganishii CBS 8797]